jgi:hypothetical protein
MDRLGRTAEARLYRIAQPKLGETIEWRHNSFSPGLGLNFIGRVFNFAQTTLSHWPHDT